MEKFGFFFLFCLALATSSAQSYSFKNYTTHDGLVQTNITDIKQDKRGNIWIATNGGLSLFDGKKFTNYDDQELLRSLHINALLCDSEGIMWIATANGLLKYENTFELFFKPKGNISTPVTSLSVNSQNQLLFVCNGILYQLKNNRAEPYLIKNEAVKDLSMAAFDREDNLWMIKNDLTLYRKNDSGLVRIHTPFSTAQMKLGLAFMKIEGKENSVPYFITNFGTYWVKNDSLSAFVNQYPKFYNAKIGHATYVLEDGDSTQWIGGVVGLSKLSGESVIRYVKENGFCDNSVSCLFMDREKNLWIGCTYNGVYKLSSEALFHVQTFSESTDLRHVSAIAPISNETTVLGTWGKGIFLLNKNGVSHLQAPPYLLYISCMATLGETTLFGWFGKGLWTLNNKTQQVAMVSGFAKEETVSKLLRFGQHLVVQTLDNTCYLTDYNLNIQASVKLPEDFDIAVVQDKIYQLSPVGQVDILNDNLQVIRKNIFPDISSTITGLTCYHDNFLIGTFGQGLFMYDQRGKLLKRIDKKNGFNTNIITSLLVDGHHFYIGTNLGLIITGLPELRDIKIGNENGGLFNWECRPGGLKKLADGSILIATTNGPYIYYPEKDIASQYTSAVLTLSGFNYGENLEKYTALSSVNSNLQLPDALAYNDRQVSISLNGVSQRDPDGIAYHYQLNGYDSAWITTANPVLKFSSLGPGDYKLKAYASVGDFISKPVSLQFSISKPLSGRLWFQLLLIAALASVCWLLLTIGNRVYQKYIQTKVAGKMESDMALKQQLSAHTLSFAEQNFKAFSEVLQQRPNKNGIEKLTPVFLKDAGKRIRLLWKKDKISLQEFHQYFDELLLGYGSNAKVYHRLSAEEIELHLPTVFPVLQLFSLYLFFGLYENCAAAFSLDSELNTNGQVLLRFYMVTHSTLDSRLSVYHFLNKAITDEKTDGLTMDIIENLELGNMVIAEINLLNEKDS